MNAGVAKVAHVHFLAEFAFREKVFAPNAKEMLFAVWVEYFNFPFFFVSFFCGCLGAIVADLLVAPNFDYEQIKGLRLEATQKLNEIKPLSVAQASRISGVNPADIAVLIVYMKANKKENQPMVDFFVYN